MPRLVRKKPGMRVNIWLDGESLEVAGQIENLSGFVQMALRQAAGIMAMDMIVAAKELQDGFPKPTTEQIAIFNARHPQDELTQKRTTQNEPAGTAPIA